MRVHRDGFLKKHTVCVNNCGCGKSTGEATDVDPKVLATPSDFSFPDGDTDSISVDIYSIYLHLHVHRHLMQWQIHENTQVTREDVRDLPIDLDIFLTENAAGHRHTGRYSSPSTRAHFRNMICISTEPCSLSISISRSNSMSKS